MQRVELDGANGNNAHDIKQQGADKTITLLLYVRENENCESETWALKEKKALFEQQFEVQLSFEVARETLHCSI